VREVRINCQRGKEEEGKEDYHHHPITQLFFLRDPLSDLNFL